MTTTDRRPTTVIPRRKKLFLFEKDKGGVGSTGSLVTIAHMLCLRGEHVEFIEASLTQLDIANAYGEHHPVHELDLKAQDADIRVIDIVDRAPDGAYILANVPAGRLDELMAVHRLIIHAAESGMDLADTSVVWTMGLDAASRPMFLTLMEGELPGRVLLNLPAWTKEDPTQFATVDQEVLSAVEATGGRVFATPAMPTRLYDYFRTEQIAIDRIATLPGVGLGERVALSQWEKFVALRLGSIF